MAGLPHLAQLVYLMGIRPYMDFETAVVGWRRGISIQSLREETFVEPVPGRHSHLTGSPSRKAVINSLESLVSAGLLERRPAKKRLVYLLSLALSDKSSQKRRGIGGAEEGHGRSGTENKSKNNNLDNRTGIGGAEEGHGRSGTPPLSVINTHTVRPRENSQDKCTIEDEWVPSKDTLEQVFMSGCGQPDALGIAEFVAANKSRAWLSADWDAEFKCFCIRNKHRLVMDKKKQSKQKGGMWDHLEADGVFDEQQH